MKWKPPTCYLRCPYLSPTTGNHTGNLTRPIRITGVRAWNGDLTGNPLLYTFEKQQYNRRRTYLWSEQFLFNRQIISGERREKEKGQKKNSIPNNIYFTYHASYHPRPSRVPEWTVTGKNNMKWMWFDQKKSTVYRNAMINDDDDWCDDDDIDDDDK